MSDAQQRYVMFTGGSQGIGLAPVHKLAAQGCHIVIASCNQQACVRAIEQVKVATHVGI